MLQTNRSYSSSGHTIMPPARGAKTLGWFMDQTDILKGQTTTGGPGAIGQGRRGSSSDESKSTTPSSISQPPSGAQRHHQYQPNPQFSTSTSSSTHHHHHHQNHPLQQQQQQKKQKKYRKTISAHGAARKDGFHAAGNAMSESSEDGGCFVPPPTTVPSATVPATTVGGGGAAAPTTTTQQGSTNDEYWFYDVATDGYYYEQNGAKGWRRRQPNAAVHKANGKDQEVAHMNVNGRSKYDHLLAAQAAAAQAAFIQHAFHLQQAAQQVPTPTGAGAGGAGAAGAQNPTMRYYDPNSDGFFYEMASVDGWKRRQPNKPVSASLPNGITHHHQRPPYSQRPSEKQASYGAALARGQFPRNTVKQDGGSTEVLLTTPITTPGPTVSRDSASTSSQCGDNNAATTTTTFAELFGSTDPIYHPPASSSIQRPSALNLEQQSSQLENNAPLNSTAALFEAVLADFNAGGGAKPPMYQNVNSVIDGSMTTQMSPMKESWNSFRSCSLFSPIKPSKRVVLAPPIVTGSGSVFGGASGGSLLQQHQQPMGHGVMTPMIDEMDDDSTMKMLMNDLDKLWANTPVSGLNQA